MTIQAQLADGRTLEFPDGTDPQVIQATVKKVLGVQGAPQQPVEAPLPEGGAISQVLEPAATLVSGAIAEPLAGLAGIAQAVNPFAEPGAGAEAVEATREALTFQPRTQAGQAGLQAVAEAVAPIGEAFGAAEEALGEAAFEATGSPAAAAIATAIPTAAAELVGAATAKGVVSATNKVNRLTKDASIVKAIETAAPTIERIKTEARTIYSAIDDLGVTVKDKTFKKLTGKLKATTRKEGFSKNAHPKVAATLSEFDEIVGTSPDLTEVDRLRKVAQGAASSIEPAEARLGAIMIDEIDQFLDNLGQASLNTAPGVNVGQQYRQARSLWSRAKKSEIINEAMEKARLQASGFENGIRVQFRSILNNKKRSRGFSANEKEAMRKVVLGGGAENIAKAIGKFGFTEGQATSMLLGSLGVAGGAAIGGPVGAVVVPGIGQISKSLAQRLTRGNAAFADQVVRAGKDAKKITASYLKNTPKAQRTVEELTELLINQDANVSGIIRLPPSAKNRQLIQDAAFLAKRLQEDQTIAAGIAGATVLGQTGEQ